MKLLQKSLGNDTLLLLKLGDDEMIQCELCNIYFHADEISTCPGCGKELCESCYEEHVTRCMAQDISDEDEDEECKYPHECPKCGAELELDVQFGETSTIYCTNPECDFTMDYINEDDNEDD